ncbi:hypothetical protein HDA40_001536 [Hamadaea flava]|uniref:Aminoglycoside phosphotransferase domain-containing protein n=1 Tax=Hamadaea flava TaxID=1742688 RepID=A0ABV8LNP1_9ACTN|nr:hypothetical protein [Hamadaea flava]MCP2323029.1 hypothetical protein [Hamadaea flava]
MEQPDEFRQLADYLGTDSADAVRGWCRANGHRVRVPRPPWRSSDGYSGAWLHSLLVDRGRVSYKVLVKRIPPWPENPSSPGWPTGEPARHRFFLDDDPTGFARDHLVGQRFDALTTQSGHVLMFQDLAADGGTTVPLAEVPPERLADACALVLGGVTGSWNDYRLSRPSVSVSRFLHDEVGATVASGGTLNGWARRAGLLDIRDAWLMVDPAGPVLPNPLPSAAGHWWDGTPPPIDVLSGRTHGDLHLLNVLIPVTPDGVPDLGAYRIIDLATARETGSLTRDLVTMLLSAIGGGLDSLPEDRWQPLIRHLLDLGRGDGPEPPFAVTTALCETFARTVSRTRTGSTGAWQLQYWLSLQALGLAFTAYARFRPAVRWWFFQLAAYAAGAALRVLAPGRVAPRTARLVPNPFQVGQTATDQTGTPLSAYDRKMPEPDDEAGLVALFNEAVRLEATDTALALRRYQQVFVRARSVLGADHQVTVRAEAALRRWDLRR